MERKNNYNFNILPNLESNLESINYNVVLILYYGDLRPTFTKLNTTFNLNLDRQLKDSIIYNGTKGECNIFYNNNIKYIFVRTNDDSDKLTGIIGKNILKEREDISLLVIINEDYNTTYIKYINSLLQGLYRFDEFKTIDSINIQITFHIIDNSRHNIEQSIKQSIEQNKILYEIRDLANTPVNKLNSTKYEEIIRAGISSNSNIEIEVLNKPELTEQSLNLILEVNKGSIEEPKMIILDYNPNNDDSTNNTICLVGKGVMYDTGGINLKSGNMTDMKIDMVGSAIVYGVIKALALKKCNKRVIGILPIVQNDIGPNATHPGDIITSYSGKTVEITDTDAEGRLILADGIAYCKKYNPTLIIDIGS
jgi:leucyl aminopeptidase